MAHEDDDRHPRVGRRPRQLPVSGHRDDRASRLAVVGKDPECAGRHGEPERLPGRDHVASVGYNALHPKPRIVPADRAARKSAGIAPVILKPDLHPALLALVDQEPDETHVLRREILGLEAPRGVEHDDIGAVGVELLDLGEDVLPGLQAAPNGPVDGAELARRRWERGGRLRDRWDGDLPPGLRGPRLERKADAEGPEREGPPRHRLQGRHRVHAGGRLRGHSGTARHAGWSVRWRVRSEDRFPTAPAPRPRRDGS